MKISAVIFDVDGTVAETEESLTMAEVRERAGWVKSKIRNVHPPSPAAQHGPMWVRDPRLGSRSCALRIPFL